jgi:hypothetical protein
MQALVFSMPMPSFVDTWTNMKGIQILKLTQ